MTRKERREILNMIEEFKTQIAWPHLAEDTCIFTHFIGEEYLNEHEKRHISDCQERLKTYLCSWVYPKLSEIEKRVRET